jgi:hypothetical protein
MVGTPGGQQVVLVRVRRESSAGEVSAVTEDTHLPDYTLVETRREMKVELRTWRSIEVGEGAGGAESQVARLEAIRLVQIPR